MLNLDINQVRREWEMAGHGNKAAVLEWYADRAGVSTGTVYRAIRAMGGKKREVEREKKVPEEILREIAKIKERGRLLTKGAGIARELSTEDCIQMLKDQNVPGAEDLTVSTVNRRLAGLGFRKRDPKSRYEVSEANMMWQMDFSRSKYFQVWKFDQAKRDFILRVHGRELHYKKDDQRMRTWIAAVIDEHSRAEDFHAYAASGESWVIGLDMLHRIFNRDVRDPHPMRHIPERLKTDNGAFIKRAEVKAALTALGIQSRTIKPGAHDSQGKIEVRFRIIWNKFELALAIRLGAKATICLSEYNELLHEFAVGRLARQHPLYRETCGAVYASSIQRRPQVKADIDLLQHAFRVDYRTVNDCLLFSWHGLAYRAPYWGQNKRVRIYQNLNEEVLVESIEDGRIEKAVPPQEGEKFPYCDADDFEHRPHATYRQIIETEVEREDLEKKVPAPYSDGKRIFMPPREYAVEPQSPFDEKAKDGANETEFRSADLARMFIGEQVYAMTNGECVYDDLKDIFDGLIERTLSKAEIKRKLEDLREVFRRQTIQVIKLEAT